MTSHRALGSVLHNFLETYSSRYSEYEGYWVFGLLVQVLREETIDLLATAAVEATPTNFAVRLAASRFRDQVQKAGLDLARVPEARLLITRSPTARGGQVNGHARAGYEVKFVAMARSDRGRTFEREKSVFVAPHDPAVERRSGRAT